MRLLRAHIIRSVVSPFIFAWAALTGMLMLNQLSRRFADLVGKGLPAGVITEVLLLFIPFIVALTLPMAILVAVLYGFSQLGSDNEITAMRAGGISVAQMVRPVLSAGILLAILNFGFIDQVLPRTNLRLLNLQNDIGQKKPTFALKEAVMNNIPGSLYVLQANRIEEFTGRMREIVIYDMSPADGRRVIYADSGYMAFLDNGKDLLLKLYDGKSHEYKTAEPSTVRITRFGENTVNVRDIQNAFQQSFGTVARGDREMTTCEMMDRVASARREAGEASDKARLMAENDLRAMMRHYGVVAPPPGVAARVESCSWWRPIERAIAGLILPKPAKAQSPTPGDSARAAAPYVASMATISDATIAAEEIYFARRDVRQYQVEIHKKLTLSFACISFVLIGIALALRFPRGGIGLVIGASLVIFALFYVSLTAGEQLADQGYMSPALAMWFPNGVVFIAGLLGLLRVNKEFGSTRGGDLSDLADLLFGWLRRRKRAPA
jgi:lipopolysaccharide export system permease protein